MAITEVSQTGDDTTTSTTYTAFTTDMTITPGAGDWLFVFTTSIKASGAGEDRSLIALFKAGTIISHTEREMLHETSIDGFDYFHGTHAHVSLTAGQAVNIRWKSEGGIQMTAAERTLVCFPITASEPTSVEETTDDSTTSSTYVDIANTTITPGAGKYLAVFTGSWQQPPSPNDGDLQEMAIHVAGTIVAHTERRLTGNDSVGDTSFNVLIAAEVNPGAGEAVAVKWKTPTASAMVIHERTLTLYAIDAVDIDEISQTGDDTTSSTSYVSFATPLKITPGDDDWLTIFSSSYENTITGNPGQFSQIFENDVAIPHTERNHTGESSLFDAAQPVGTHGVATVGAAQDIEIKWHNDDAGATTISHERTLVAIREPSAAVFTGSAAISIGSTVVAASGTFIAPIFTGSAAISIGSTVVAASGIFIAPTIITPTRREQFINDSFTTLNESLDNSETVITVSSGAVFPTKGDFRIIVEDEVMLCTSRSSNDLTVVRGVDDTTAVTHADSLTIKAVMSATQIIQFVDDAWFGGTGRKPYRLLDTNGTTLTSSDFTFLNQGTSSVADDPFGGLTVTVNETTGDWKMLHKTAPTPPYIVTAHLMFGPGATYSSSGSLMGIGGRESSTGEFIVSVIETGDKATAFRFNSPSSFNSTWGSLQDVDFDYDQMWVQFEDDNTDVFARVSNDGINFFQIATEGRTAFMAGGADQIVWAFNPRGDADKLMHLRSWIEE